MWSGRMKKQFLSGGGRGVNKGERNQNYLVSEKVLETDNATPEVTSTTKKSKRKNQVA